VWVLQLNGLRLRFVKRVFFYEHTHTRAREREREKEREREEEEKLFASTRD
jgi:hypothetical protein